MSVGGIKRGQTKDESLLEAEWQGARRGGCGKRACLESLMILFLLPPNFPFVSSSFSPRSLPRLYRLLSTDARVDRIIS